MFVDKLRDRPQVRRFSGQNGEAEPPRPSFVVKNGSKTWFLTSPPGA
ncbi:MAG: hypothetical protein JWO51_4067 [Rhodospirillales bacterium]|nr:hypothetical protein [Rhodospirillales bacterium]